MCQSHHHRPFIRSQTTGLISFAVVDYAATFAHLRLLAARFLARVILCCSATTFYVPPASITSFPRFLLLFFPNRFPIHLFVIHSHFLSKRKIRLKRKSRRDMSLLSSSSPLLLLLVTFVLLLGSICPTHCRHVLHKRQTFEYPAELKEYAQNYHTGTRVIHGTLGRFAPQEWPAWYTRTMMKWNGESRMSPYSPNDVQYRSWRMNRILSEQP